MRNAVPGRKNDKRQYGFLLGIKEIYRQRDTDTGNALNEFRCIGADRETLEAFVFSFIKSPPINHIERFRASLVFHYTLFFSRSVYLDGDIFQHLHLRYNALRFVIRVELSRRILRITIFFF